MCTSSSRVNLPSIKRQQTCPICLHHLAAAENRHSLAVVPRCLHAYCFDCIRKWSHVKRSCPLCNAAFDSVFVCRTKPTSSSSRRRRQQEELVRVELSAPAECRTVISQSPSRLRYNHRRMMMTVRRSRNQAEINEIGRKTRPLPRQRTFGGRQGSVPHNVVMERKLQWRASVYSQNMEAVPLTLRDCSEQSTSRGSCSSERIRQRIEPWIWRELQALLDDPDPSILVHVASSLYMTYLERNAERFPAEDSRFLFPLRPFLCDRTNAFWHELRNFAESSLTMETYDEVARYVKSDELRRG